jgi:phosphoribosylaminoimidazole-succinocarboxamide synthase
MTTLRESTLPDLIHRGKVRDTHDLGEGLLLMVATDRLSAFDVVLPTSIPDKGAVLNQVSAFWFDKTSHIVPNHFISLATEKAETLNIPHEVARRAMVVLKAERIDVECVVRGYITGSAWSEYRKEGTVGGQPMPQGMQEGDKFPEPLFTPTTKAEVGHDEAMTIGEVEDMVGVETAAALAETTKSVYDFAHDLALTKGIIIADTKLEFGTIDGNLTLIDELLTPDSSRFWDQIGYAPGKSQPNFDKQFVRDWLNEQGWDHEPPAPELPDDVVNRTRQRYEEALQKLTGAKLA